MSDRWSGNASLINTGPRPLNRDVMVQYHNSVASVRGPKHSVTPFSKYVATLGYVETWDGVRPDVEVRPNTWFDWFPALKRTNTDHDRRQHVETYKPVCLLRNEWQVIVMYFMGPRAFLIMHEPKQYRFRMSIHYTVERAKQAVVQDRVTWVHVEYYTPPS